MTVTNLTLNATRDGILSADGAEVITMDQSTGRELARYPVAGIPVDQCRAIVLGIVRLGSKADSRTENGNEPSRKRFPGIR